MTALLLNHLWQSTLCAGGAGLLVLVLALHRNGANVRFWLWFAASVKFLIPFAAVSALGAYLTPIVPPTVAPAVLLVEPLAEPFSAPATMLATTALTAAPAAPPAADFDLGSVLLAVWAAGFLVIVLRWLVRWSRVRALLRDASLMRVDAPVAVKFSSSRLEPGLVGIFRPVILLPQDIEQQLSPSELKAVLAHELCHWRRRDNLLAAVHMLVEALFWFFPLVWWLGARLNAERERACDESVLADGNDPQMYAEGILKVCRAYLQSPLACVAGISGAGLKQRIGTIMENRLVLRMNAVRKAVLSAAAALTLALPLALGLTVAPVPVQLQAIASVLSQPLNIVEHPRQTAAPLSAAKVESVVSRPEPALVVPPRTAIEAVNIQPVVTLQDAALEPAMLPASANTPSATGSDEISIPCFNRNVFGRVVSPGLVQMPGFVCQLGVGDAGPAGSRTFGPCPYMEAEPKFANRMTTDTRLGSYALDRARFGWPGTGSCTFDVAMNVRLADPSDAGKMIPGTTVRLAGDFRIATRDRTDYLSVSNAKLVWVDPFVAANADAPVVHRCVNRDVTGQVVSPRLIQMPSFACDPGADHENARGKARIYGDCSSSMPDNVRETRFLERPPSCTSSVTMAVELADPADAARMKPGTTVRLMGVFRATTRDRADHLSVSNAKLVWADPFAASEESQSAIACRMTQLGEIASMPCRPPGAPTLLCRNAEPASGMHIQGRPICLTESQWAERAEQQRSAKTGSRWRNSAPASPTTQASGMPAH